MVDLSTRRRVPAARYARWAIVLGLVLGAPAGLFAQSNPGSLRGQVLDASGGVMRGVAVTATGADGTVKAVETNGEGRYVFEDLKAGKYTVRATAKGFAPFESTAVEVMPGRTQILDIHLAVTMEKEQVTVSDTPKVDVSPTSNVGALVLKGQDLEMLSDNPDDLAADLQALAGPAAGPNGGQIYIDGFTGGKLPPKSSIREIRINQNPFSAEYEKLGFGRIEIFTKPGTDKFHGRASFSFGDARFNSRNPFALTRPPYQQKRFETNLSGPLSKKASFFLGIEGRDIQDVAVINALDPANNFVSSGQSVVTPRKDSEINPRIDYQLSTNHTLVARFGYNPDRRDNQGVGQFSLPSQAYHSNNTESSAQLTETAVLGPRSIDETRFRFLRSRDTRTANGSGQPTINVPQSFTGGAPGFSRTSDDQDNYELQNLVSLTRNKHVVRFGGRLRHDILSNFSDQNYNGTFQFDSIDAYKSGRPSQFSITFGNKLAKVRQSDVGIFVQDDWRLRQNLSVNLGLRYETQSNLSDRSDIAPRVAFAWAIGGGKNSQPKTVIRGGAGVFYDRFGESYTLQAQRLNGQNQRQYVVCKPGFYPTVPSEAFLASVPNQPCNRPSGSPSNLLPTIRQVDPNLRAPYIVQEALSLERQLPKNVKAGLTYAHSHGVHNLRSRNINAPLASGSLPYPNEGNIYSYESSGVFNQDQLIVSLNARVGPKFTFFGFYMLNQAKSDTDGAGSFPANQYDLRPEYGRAAFDIRQRVFMGGSFNAPLGLRVFPFIVASSGQPFNITIGRDVYNDSLYTARPAFATDLTRPGIRSLGSVSFDPDILHLLPGQTIVPRNYGNGPGLFALNLRLSRTFGFGEPTGGGYQGAGGKRGGHGGPGGALSTVAVRPAGGGGGEHGGGGGGGHGLGGLFGDSMPSKRYNLTFSISAQNVFNSVNLAPPVGNLSSQLFDQSTSIAGGFGPGGGGGGRSSAANRRIELQMNFSF